ncbi:MAG: ABC transporter ATP-binding protein/permease [Limnochordia bacterium]|jgi:ATP-binding cassette subfamily B protein|nr:ABC transporter ATP-binding protein/permease [Limnochordia bacterium]MDD4517421.1 ABC transporter transmembrane domain-containing protein [Limnochordia bacterium]
MPNAMLAKPPKKATSLPKVEQSQVLPSEVERIVALAKSSEENTVYTLQTDLSLDGLNKVSWLVATESHLYLVDEERILQEVPLTDIADIRLRGLVGNGFLDVYGPTDLLFSVRYSNALARKFAEGARALNQLRLKGEVPPPSPDVHRMFCEKCGRVLPPRTGVCPACLDKKKVMRRLLNYTRPYFPHVFGIVVLMWISTAINLLPPMLNRYLVDDVLIPKDAYWLPWIVLALLLARVGNIGVAIARGRASAWLGSKISHDIRYEVYSQLQQLSIGYYDRQQLGSVVARVTHDANRLERFLLEAANYVLVEFFTLIGIGVMLFIMNWKLTLLVLVPAPLVVIGSTYAWRKLHGIYRRFWQKNSSFSGAVNDSLAGIRIVRAFAQEEKEIEKFSRHNYELYEAGVRAGTMEATIFPVLSFLTGVGGLLVWYVGGHQVIGGSISLGTLMAFIGYLGMFYGPLQAMSRLSDFASRSLAAAERIFEVLDAKPEVADAPKPVPINEIEGRVEFVDVTFGYEKHKPVLRNIDLQVEPGEMIGLVGHSGAGKSTMINLLCRFYDVDEGQILIDGHDIRDIPQRKLREQIGVVLQDTFLFNGTIADNIAYAKPDATLEEIMQAAMVANAHEFILRKPDGYDSPVGERGSRLSGGERQRISIARAVLHNPRILILDEATASVDTHTEEKIQEAIARLIEGRTTFAIAHRLSTLRNANRLFVLEKGRNVELGTHAELLAKRGVYYNLVQTQRKISRMKGVDG